MGLVNGGEEYFIKTGLTEQIAVPANFQVGLSQDDEATLGESVTLATINEVAGAGYARVSVASDALDWTAMQESGDWLAQSKELTFSATGTWDTAKSAFLTDGTRVLATKDLLQPVTLTNGKSFKAVMKVKAT